VEKPYSRRSRQGSKERCVEATARIAKKTVAASQLLKCYSGFGPLSDHNRSGFVEITWDDEQMKAAGSKEKPTKTLAKGVRSHWQVTSILSLKFVRG
jgi:hypothetical protein